jgi:teichuronic acid biosynthesis glycosyltransferase TuaC
VNVLFISSGNTSTGISVLVYNQGESIRKQGIGIEYFTLKGKGLTGYLKNIYKLRRYINKNKFDLYHAHYSLSAFVATLAGCSPLVVSLMGSDTYSNILFNYLIRFFYRFYWHQTIVKTIRMKENLKLHKAIVLPNGVDMERFRLIDKELARKQVGFISDKKYVIFVADPSRPEKNFRLAKQAVDIIGNENVILYPVFGAPNEMISFYMNAADVLIITSLWEGSVNVIKEAAACCLPIISVDVGDVKEVIGNIEGCFICNFNAEDSANKIKTALAFNQRTNGRQRIMDLQLDSISIAGRIIDVYKSITNNR